MFCNVEAFAKYFIYTNELSRRILCVCDNKIN